jgi:hypothetical protein
MMSELDVVMCMLRIYTASIYHHMQWHCAKQDGARFRGRLGCPASPCQLLPGVSITILSYVVNASCACRMCSIYGRTADSAGYGKRVPAHGVHGYRLQPCGSQCYRAHLLLDLLLHASALVSLQLNNPRVFADAADKD